MNFPSWTAVALDGEAVVLEVDDSIDPYGLVGWRRSAGWRRFIAEPVDTPTWIGAVALAEGGVAVITDGTLDGVSVRQIEGKAVVATHEHSGSTLMAEIVGMVVLSQFAPILLTGLFALVLSGRMQAHRVTEYEMSGRVARYASLTRRGLAKLVDGSIAAVVPGAVLLPAVLGDGGSFDQDGAMQLTLLWCIPVGVVFTILEGVYGWTPGKKLLGIRVVGLHLQPAGIGAAFLRGLVGAVDGFFSCLVGVVVIAGNRHWQRVGDQVAQTIVIDAAIVERDGAA
jgi:uncharacterized RDD family membrane protein YckC